MHWTSKEKNPDILGVVRQSVRVALTFPGTAAEHLYLYGTHRLFDVWEEEWTGECEAVYIQDPRHPAYPAYFVVPIALCQQTREHYSLTLLFAPPAPPIRRRRRGSRASSTRRRRCWSRSKTNRKKLFGRYHRHC